MAIRLDRVVRGLAEEIKVAANEDSRGGAGYGTNPLIMHQLVTQGVHSPEVGMRSINFKVQASQGVWRAESWPPRSGGVVEASPGLTS